MSTRWNFRLGPLQFTSPVTMASVVGIAGVVLCCCGPGVVMTLMEDTPSGPPPSAPVATPAPATPRPTATPTAKPTKAAGKAKTVTAGAFCDTLGDAGVSKTGTPMVCKGPGDLRWRRR